MIDLVRLENTIIIAFKKNIISIVKMLKIDRFLIDKDEE